MEKLKVLFPIGAFYPAQIGGPSNTVYWIAKALGARKIEPTVVTTTKGLKSGQIVKNQWKDLDGIKVIYHDYKFWQFPIKFLKSTIKKAENNEVIILSSFFYLPSVIIALLLSSTNKVIISPRGEFSKSALKFNFLSKKFRLILIKTLVGKKISFHSTSKQETADIKGFFPDSHILEIPNYMELPEPLHLDKENFFLYLGRLHPIKALENILEGLNQSKKFRDSNYKFIIAGKESDTAPGYYNNLIKLITELNLTHKVEFLGMVTGSCKQELLAKAKFLFLLSNSENFGNVIIEALAQNTPVLASKGTPWEILNNEKAGYWICNSPKHIAEKIDLIVDLDNNQYSQLIANSYHLVKRRFDIESNIQNWLESIKQL